MTRRQGSDIGRGESGIDMNSKAGERERRGNVVAMIWYLKNGNDPLLDNEIVPRAKTHLELQLSAFLGSAPCFRISIVDPIEFSSSRPQRTDPRSLTAIVCVGYVLRLRE